MFPLPPATRTHWVYDDPSGVAEPQQPAPAPPATRRRATKVLSFLLRPAPATPRAT